MENRIIKVRNQLSDRKVQTARTVSEQIGFCARRGRWSLGFVQTLALVSLGSVLCLGAAEPETAAEPWVSLFNGTNFAGWKIVALTNHASAVVEDGVMVLRQRTNTIEHTFVASERAYDDFILDLDLKDDSGFNSGILLRCVEAPADAKVRLNGYQVKVDNTPRAWTGGIFDDFGDSWKWLHDLADNERGRAAFKLGEWAHIRIECIGPTIKVWVNGVPTCHLVDKKYSKGVIAFKIHALGNSPKDTTSVIRLKNIRIITGHPERYALPMALPPRHAPTEPGKFDKAKPLPQHAFLLMGTFGSDCFGAMYGGRDLELTGFGYLGGVQVNDTLSA